MLENLPITQDFKLLYDYMNHMGTYIPVLRIPIIDKTKLKSNNYWLMAVIGKMPALDVLILHRPHNGPVLGQDGWKFLEKGFKYMHENGRSLKKIKMHNFSGNSDVGDKLYPCLKQLESLNCIDLSNFSLRS